MHFIAGKIFRRNSKVLELQNDDANIRGCAILNRDKSITVGIVNRNKKAVEIKLDCDLFEKDVRVYEYDSHNVPYNKFADMQDYTEILSRENVSYTLKPDSVTYFTTDYITKEHRIYAENVQINNGILSWDKTEDKSHCYYRIFADNEKDFAPAAKNQIASTIGNSLRLKEEKKYYKVISVDKSGNM